MFVIKMSSGWYCMGYSNTFANPVQGQLLTEAMQFPTEQEAMDWSKRYLCGYKIEIERIEK